MNTNDQKVKSRKRFFPAIWNYTKNNPIVIMMVIVSLAVGFTVDNFFSWNNFNNLSINTSVRFIIALGVSGTLITKGTDLSAGRQVGLAACLTAMLVQRADYADKILPLTKDMNVWLVLLIVIAVGALLGLLNGFIIAVINIPPFIATLGTQTMIYGISLIITDSQPVGGLQKNYIEKVNKLLFKGDSYPGLPVLLIVAVVFGLLFWFLYEKTTHGKYMYAIGGNEAAAEVSGVNTRLSKILVYTIAGVMYAIAGFLLAGKAGGSSAGLGSGYELEAIAGCTIGGVSTTGGVGTIGGVLVGVLVFELLKIVLQFLGVNPYYNYIVQGLVIVIAVAVDIRKYIKRK